jgi:hypothetical protein
MFNCCPFIDDRLRQLLKEEMMNVHQPILPNITIVVLNVFVIRIQAMNPRINIFKILMRWHNFIDVSLQILLLLWSQQAPIS